ncbi:MAG: hypothetical protein ABL949_15970, partial [Fimbriimonadaceae bacterium]
PDYNSATRDLIGKSKPSAGDRMARETRRCSKAIGYRTIREPAPGFCGAYGGQRDSMGDTMSWDIKWNVTARQYGWVIQHITSSYRVKPSCVPPYGNCDVLKDESFFEAWYVSGGQTMIGLRPKWERAGSYDDHWFDKTECRCHEGAFKTVAKAIFISAPYECFRKWGLTVDPLSSRKALAGRASPWRDFPSKAGTSRKLISTFDCCKQGYCATFAGLPFEVPPKCDPNYSVLSYP